MRVQKAHVRYSKMRLDCSDPTEASERTDPLEAEEPIPAGSQDGRQTPTSRDRLRSRESSVDENDLDLGIDTVVYSGLDEDMADTMSDKDRAGSNQNIPFVDETDGEPDPEGITNEALDKSPTDQDNNVGPSSQDITDQGKSPVQPSQVYVTENSTTEPPASAQNAANPTQLASGISTEELPQSKEGASDPEAEIDPNDDSLIQPDPPSDTESSMPRREAFMLSEDSDLFTRTSWVDAHLAYKQVKRGKANGNTSALWLRMHLQTQLYHIGCYIQKHCEKVLFVGLLLLSLCCVGLKTATIETNVEKLWVEAGGRLEKELQHSRDILGEGSGGTSELVIQTPKNGHKLLSPESLLLHKTSVVAATKIKVTVFDKTWKFKDICMKGGFPSFEDPLFDTIIETILPCIIITPLDCFWEGSKALGPEYGLYVPGYDYHITWANLNPKELVEAIDKQGISIPLESINDIFVRAGVDDGYQSKPCLDPIDPECPPTAPNKVSKVVPDVGAEMTGGCSGYAAKFMHWEEDLIIGGIQRNKTGHIVKAAAYQSILLLDGEKDLYERYRDDYKVQSIEWDQKAAKKVLEEWQRAFSREMQIMFNESTTEGGNILAFSGTSLLDLLNEFSQVSILRVLLGYVFMVVYACISLMRWSDPISSQGGIGMIGVLLVALSVAAGLGICSVIGIAFNASTTQILPFLALGIGVDDMFLIAHSFGENVAKDIPHMQQTGEVLKRTGVSVMLTSISNMCAFFIAAIIPIPALRAFSLQSAILVLFNLITIVIVYPAVISLDLKRREEKLIDVFCCFKGSTANDVMVLTSPSSGSSSPPEYRKNSPPPPYSPRDSPPHYNTIAQTDTEGNRTTTVLANGKRNGVTSNAIVPSSLPPSTTSSQQCLTPEENSGCGRFSCCSWSLTSFAANYYGPALQKTPIKVLVIISFLALLIAGIVGTIKVEDGLDLVDIVPSGTQEWGFLDAQDKYFGFYNMYLVTKGDFDYTSAEHQKLLYEYHKSFEKVDNVIKNDDGTLPDFWLKLMRDWLLGVQESFDRDMAKGYITRDGWNKSFASNEAILGYKLMVQTGDTDMGTLINKNRVLTGRLVDNEGIIFPPAFYNFLTVWVSNDALAYAAAMPNFHPVPNEWIHTPESYELNIPKSQPLKYAQIPFYLNNLGETKDITNMINEIRDICDTMEAKGLPNYPSGIPFTFWEQYINLRFYLMMSLICVICGIFLVITIILMNPWMALVVVAVLAMMVVELFGFMGFVGIKLSAVPAVILIVSVGIGVEFTVHITLGFITGIGSRNRRMQMTLEHMFAPVVHGAVSTLLGVVMLAGAEFEFIVKYFFSVLTVLVILGVLNGLILLPVLLSILGPNGEVVPLNKGNMLPPPTPEPSPLPERPVRTISRRVYPRMPSDISLTTITEEPTQYSSHEIIVQPEVVVETTIPGGGTSIVRSGSTRNPSPPSSSSSTPSSSRHVTTVRATAKVKVEVHHPHLPGSVDQEHTYKSKKRKSRESSFSDSESSC